MTTLFGRMAAWRPRAGQRPGDGLGFHAAGHDPRRPRGGSYAQRRRRWGAALWVLIPACLAVAAGYLAAAAESPAPAPPPSASESPAGPADTPTPSEPPRADEPPPPEGETPAATDPGFPTAGGSRPPASLAGPGETPAAPDSKDTPFRILEADTIEQDFATNRVVAQGNVVCEYKDYRVTADVLAADFEERTATFRGRVVLTTPERVIHGTLLSLSLRDRSYTFEGARMVLQPDEVQMGAQQPLYATGAHIDGKPGQVLMKRTGVTSCDLGSPHYLFDAQSVKIFPGKRLTARKVSFYALGHKIITVPGITIPLSTINTPQSSRLVPVAGQSLDEGYYLKTAYFYVIGALIGNLRLDLMSKKGMGIGLDQPYDFPKYNGTVHLYQLNNRQDNRKDFNARLDHQHQLGDFAVRAGTDYRMNSLPYAAATSSSLLTDLGITRRSPDGTSTDLGVNRSSSSYGGTDTGNWVARLNHSQALGPVRASMSFDLSQPFGQRTASTGRLGSRLNLQHSNRLFSAELLADRVDTLGGTANFFTGTQHLPELYLRTSSNQIVSFLSGKTADSTPEGEHRSFWVDKMPVSAEMRIGSLREGGYSTAGSTQKPEVKKRLRTYLRLTSSPEILPNSGRVGFTLPWDFQQNLYKSDEAMWAAGINPAFTYRMGGSSLLSLNYTLMRRNGYTPFTSDYAGESHQLSFAATLGSRIRRGYSGSGGGYSPYNTQGLTGGYDAGSRYGSPYGMRSIGLDPKQTGKAYVTLNTGYDFDVHNASDLVVRTQYQPGRSHLVEVETAYDWFGKRNFSKRSRLRDIRTRWYVDYGAPLQLGVGAVWDTTKSRLGTLKTSLSAQLSRNWQIQSLYGKIASSFGPSQPYTQVMLTRDLHCWDASAIYTEGTFLGRRERDFRIMLSIKAFPSNKGFGVTRSGQYLSTDIGSAY